MAKFEEVTKDNFEGLFEEGKITLIDIYAEWCGPCKMLKPVLQEVGDEKESVAILAKYDADEDVLDLTNKYSVRNLPTVLFFDHNKQCIDRLVGGLPKMKYLEKIDELLNR
jgi:thioredoxin 1